MGHSHRRHAREEHEEHVWCREHATEGRRHPLCLHPQGYRRCTRSGDRQAALAFRSAGSRRKYSLHRSLPRRLLLRRSGRRRLAGLRNANRRRHAGCPHHRDRRQDRQALRGVRPWRRGQHRNRHRPARSRHVLDHVGADDRKGRHRDRPPGARWAKARRALRRDPGLRCVVGRIEMGVGHGQARRSGDAAAGPDL